MTDHGETKAHPLHLVAYSSDESESESGCDGIKESAVTVSKRPEDVKNEPVDVKIETADVESEEKFTTYSELSSVVKIAEQGECPPLVNDEQLRERCPDRFSITDSDSDSSSWSSSDSDNENLTLRENIINQMRDHTDVNKNGRRAGPMVRGELSIYDLPPVEELNIKIGEDTVICEIGKISSIIDCLVNVEGHSTTSPVNDGTVLFKNDRTPIGRVFETFGPVKTPYYLIRFNSREHVTQTDIKPGDVVFYAPAILDEDITNYIFVDQLKKLRVTDASWKDDTERPDQFQDYSDDEEERRARSLRKARNRPPPPIEDNSELSHTGTDNKQPRIDNRNSTNTRGRGRGQRRPERGPPSNVPPLIDRPSSEVPPLMESNEGPSLMGGEIRPLIGGTRPAMAGQPRMREPAPNWNPPHHQNYMPLHRPMNNQLIHRPRLQFQPRPQFEQYRPQFQPYRQHFDQPCPSVQPLLQTNCQSWPGPAGPPVLRPRPGPAGPPVLRPRPGVNNWFEGQANTWTDKDSQHYREDSSDSVNTFTDTRFIPQ